MSAQRLQRWSNIVQKSYKCFVFAGVGLTGKLLDTWVMKKWEEIPDSATWLTGRKIHVEFMLGQYLTRWERL